MKTRIIALAVAVGLLSVVGTSASGNPTISTFSESSVRIRSARIVKAVGGFYLTGMIEPSFGYLAPRSARVRVAAYDAKGGLVAEKTDKINRSRLVKWHLRPNPRATYVVFFPLKLSQLANVTVAEGRDVRTVVGEDGARCREIAVGVCAVIDRQRAEAL